MNGFYIWRIMQIFIGLNPIGIQSPVKSTKLPDFAFETVCVCVCPSCMNYRLEKKCSGLAFSELFLYIEKKSIEILASSRSFDSIWSTRRKMELDRTSVVSTDSLLLSLHHLLFLIPKLYLSKVFTPGKSKKKKRVRGDDSSWFKLCFLKGGGE